MDRQILDLDWQSASTLRNVKKFYKMHIMWLLQLLGNSLIWALNYKPQYTVRKIDCKLTDNHECLSSNTLTNYCTFIIQLAIHMAATQCI